MDGDLEGTMSRARNIKPGFCTNEDLAECSVWARLCFALIPMLADREGRLEDRPKRIKGELFRFDNVDVEPLLVELEQHGFIARYAVNGQGLIQILGFRKHQNPHHREPESSLPCHPSLRLDGDGKYQKPGALVPCKDGEAQGKAETLASESDLASGSSRVDSGFSDSGFRIPDSKPPGGKASGALGVAELVEEGVDAQHAADWLKVRKGKKLPLTLSAWTLFKATAAKAGMAPPKAVEHCAGRGWAGFYTDREGSAAGAADDVFAGAK
jgi:hypothetical protein